MTPAETPITVERVEELAEMLPFCDLATLIEAQSALRNLAAAMRVCRENAGFNDMSADHILSILNGSATT
jgi:hypothetical protein